ncbi:MAG: hypothetical protein H7A19_01970 [Rhodanobacteraceae bacterium]|nr:hypothetical protein [Xanthomonadales bacterium]MCP5473589.1 hypothetical protein [Rhodanobacteraceae bacterium]
MNRNLIIPLIALDALAALLLAVGLLTRFSPEIEFLRPLVERNLGVPMMAAGAVLMVICGPLMIRWFIASMRERGR